MSPLLLRRKSDMCCLFGLIDYGNKLSYKQKNHFIRMLSIACESRGTDAAGIAYNHNGKMEIFKKPLPAHKFRFRIPGSVNVVMGHTRLTTQGSEKKNHNNHPFMGRCVNTNFALAHNGILTNDYELKKERKLPKTNIETDSYVAVQLIEKEGTFNIEAIKDMAESVKGSFCFTLLDEKNNTYIVKGDNPMALVNFEKYGFYAYASTMEILKEGIRKAGFKKAEYKTIPVETGDIAVIDEKGGLSRFSFNISKGYLFDEYSWYMNYCCNYDEKSILGGIPKRAEPYDPYIEELIDFGKNVGVSEEEIVFLYENGMDECDIEELLCRPEFIHEYIEAIAEMEEM